MNTIGLGIIEVVLLAVIFGYVLRRNVRKYRANEGRKRRYDG